VFSAPELLTFKTGAELEALLPDKLKLTSPLVLKFVALDVTRIPEPVDRLLLTIDSAEPVVNELAVRLIPLPPVVVFKMSKVLSALAVVPMPTSAAPELIRSLSCP